MKLAVVTMFYNEDFFLPLWVRHYKKVLPNAELILIDHGSTLNFSSILNDCSIIKIPRSPFDDEKRVKFLSNLQNTLLLEYDSVIYVDSDELLVSTTDLSLNDEIVGLKDQGVFVPIGINLIQNIAEEANISIYSNIGIERKFGYVTYSMFKPVITKEPVRWVVGFHASYNKPICIKNIALIHCRYVDIDISLSRLNKTRNMMWSDRALKFKWGAHQRIEGENMKKFFENHSRIFRDSGIDFPNFSCIESDFNSEIKMDNFGVWTGKKMTDIHVILPEGIRSQL